MGYWDRMKEPWIQVNCKAEENFMLRYSLKDYAFGVPRVGDFITACVTSDSGDTQYRRYKVVDVDMFVDAERERHKDERPFNCQPMGYFVTVEYSPSPEDFERMKTVSELLA